MAALGSIFGTFIAGFWLIQYLGTRTVLLVIAILLILLAIPYLCSVHRRVNLGLFLSIVLISGLTYWREGFINPCTRESQYYCIRVVDAQEQVSYGTARGMVLDQLLHSINFKQSPIVLLSPYVHLMDELIGYHFAQQREHISYFFAGGGAYTHPRALRAKWPSVIIDVAELDPVVTEVAESSLWFIPEGMNIYHQDARLTLTNKPFESYDVIIGDVFHDITVPYHLVTREYVALVKSRLKANGMYLMNLVDGHPDPRLLKSIYKTLRTEFRQVHIYLDKLPEHPARQTYVIVAGENFVPAEIIKPESSVSRQWKNITEEIISAGTPLQELPILTDDFVPVDRLLSGLLLSMGAPLN